MADHMLWVEKYRPKTIEECILPDSLKATFQEFVNHKEIPNLLLSGTAGVGKTTVARALCLEVGCDYIIINGSDENGVDTIRVKIKNYASSVSLMGGRKVIILDEADYLTPNAQAILRASIEEFASNCSFIFTCNFKNRIIDPIHSRCTCIDFKLNGSKVAMASKFFKRIENILTLENVKYDKEVVAALLSKHFPDNRRILNELQRFSISGVIDKGVLGSVADVQITGLIKALKEKDFAAARKWVTQNLDQDTTVLFRKIYDTMQDNMKPQSIPQTVLTLAKYQYQSAFSADREINFIAFLVELMVDVEWK
jgi:DNA polymerase III delta prime subunit